MLSCTGAGCFSSHDMADFLVNDLKRVLPRLEKQPAPVHDNKSGSGFHH